MISSWLMWVLTVAGFLALSVGAYLLGYHRGYIAGLSNSIDRLPVDPPWHPPTEADFMSELLEAERRKPELQKYPGPKKYRREP